MVSGCLVEVGFDPSLNIVYQNKFGRGRRVHDLRLLPNECLSDLNCDTLLEVFYELKVVNQARRSWLICYLTICRKKEPSERMVYTVTSLSAQKFRKAIGNTLINLYPHFFSVIKEWLTKSKACSLSSLLLLQ